MAVRLNHQETWRVSAPDAIFGEVGSVDLIPPTKNWVTMRGTSAIETVLASLFKDDRMMSALKEGELIKQWREQNPHLSQRELGRRVGRSQSFISNRMRLLKLPRVALELIGSGVITPDGARDYLLTLTTTERARVLDAIVKSGRDHFSRSMLERLVARVVARRTRLGTAAAFEARVGELLSESQTMSVLGCEEWQQIRQFLGDRRIPQKRTAVAV